MDPRESRGPGHTILTNAGRKIITVRMTGRGRKIELWGNGLTNTKKDGTGDFRGVGTRGGLTQNFCFSAFWGKRGRSSCRRPSLKETKISGGQCAELKQRSEEKKRLYPVAAENKKIKREGWVKKGVRKGVWANARPEWGE